MLWLLISAGCRSAEEKELLSPLDPQETPPSSETVASGQSEPSSPGGRQGSAAGNPSPPAGNSSREAPGSTPEPAEAVVAAQVELPPPYSVRSIIDLQAFRSSQKQELSADSSFVSAELINLNPNINRWLLLALQSGKGGETSFYHLENIAPERQRIELADASTVTLRLLVGDQATDCRLEQGGVGELARAAASGEIYAPLCEGRLYLRNPTLGNKTSVEWATDFLRNYVWGGEKITVLVRDTFFNDAYLSTSEVLAAKDPATQSRPRPPGAPLRPRIAPTYEGKVLMPDDLGISLEGADSGVLVGRWYPARDLPGIFVSAVQPRLVADVPPQLSQRNRVNQLDEIEATAMVYMVAFDLAQFDLEFVLGTDHPAVTWSTRIPDDILDPSLPGPDGIGATAPLVRTGKINPRAAQGVVASFVGGFKRYHGAFRYGPRARESSGTHYGFLESGTLMSRLQTGLATMLVQQDGRVDLKSWTDQDNAGLAHVKHARQNGLPLIEPDPVTGIPGPGALVAEPRLGNWSGSVEGFYRTVRSGVCLQEFDEHRFLLYGFFSSATAAAAARVFQSYHCSYAMLLDINALEHTYLALYREGGAGLNVEQLVKGMSVLEKKSKGSVIPRFVGYADNRDFFYLSRKAP